MDEHPEGKARADDLGTDRCGKRPIGMWTNKAEIESLIVVGRTPKIILVVAEEDTRYFWYFKKVDWLDQLEEINWGNYTYRQIIDLLEIKYDKAEED